MSPLVVPSQAIAFSAAAGERVDDDEGEEEVYEEAYEEEEEEEDGELEEEQELGVGILLLLFVRCTRPSTTCG